MSNQQEFMARVDAVLSLARADDPALLEAVFELDRLLAAADGAGEAWVGDPGVWKPICETVRREEKLIRKFGFALGLGDKPASQFCSALMTALAEHAAELSAAELLPVVAAFRREGEINAQAYSEMGRFAHLAEQKFDPNGSWDLRAKLSYERHMAAYKQGDYERSLALASQSAEEALRAGDRIAMLIARAQIAHLLSKVGRTADGFELSADVGAELDQCASSAQDQDEKDRAIRWVMNTYGHRIEMAIQMHRDAAIVGSLLRRLEANPVFAACRQQDWARRLLDHAHEYIRGTT